MFRIKHKICDPDPDKTGGTSFTQTQFDELQAEIDRLRSHSNKLLDEKKTLKTQFDEFKTQFDGIDADSVKNMMKVFESSEEAKLIAEGKLDEVIKKRTEKVILTKESAIEELTGKYNELQEKHNTVDNLYKTEKVTNELRDAAEKLDVLPTAIDDVVMRGLGIFQVGDDRKVEARDKDGNLLKVGSKVLSPELFVKDLQDKAPHFWPQSKGAGANGGLANNNGVNPFKKGKNYNLTEQAKINRADPELAAKLKKEADTSE